MIVCFSFAWVSCVRNALTLNSLPNDKFSDWSKLKAFADNKINTT